ncbi:hypothetical protein [Desulfofalx alkaliphila]|uniref:hypothetical protein n=1 Tax=Desulfofalx alkaliphila TaxID=105483 RepID=UPI0004E286C9|nr:hypothetical protein [Desulfofalx alkaliphila]
MNWKKSSVFNGQNSSLLVYHLHQFLKEYTEFLFGSVKEGAYYPLFDKLSGEIVANLLESEGINSLSNFALKRGNQVKLAQDLFERLPLFNHATINEIIDIRKELERPLRKFRVAMVEFTNDIKNAWWDREFTYEAEKVFYEKIEPAIIEIEEEVERISLMKELNKSVNITKAGVGALAGYIVDGVATTSGLNATLIGALIAGGSSAIDAIYKIREQKQVIENNRLFFYYGLRRELS